MKRFLIGLICGIVLSTTTAVYASDTIQAYLFPATFSFNGESKEMDTNEYVVLNHKGHAYVPIRFIAESMGGTVGYQQTSRTSDPTITISYPTESGLLIKDPKENRVCIGNFQFKKFLYDYPTYVTAQLKLKDAPYPVTAVLFTLFFYDENGNLIVKGDGVGQMMKSGDIQTVAVDVGSMTNYSSVTLTVNEFYDISSAGHD